MSGFTGLSGSGSRIVALFVLCLVVSAVLKLTLDGTGDYIQEITEAVPANFNMRREPKPHVSLLMCLHSLICE